jgi:peptidoglycan L-alanyl-D-glutamate endopeptidase CwlK
MILRRLTDKEVTLTISAAAKEALSRLFPKDFGAEMDFMIDGQRYVARLERHYHPPGGPLKPWGSHKGISMFLATEEPSTPAVELPASKFVLGARSLSKLVGLHPDLIRVIKRAIEITPIDFTVVEGFRTVERQKALVSSGASQTMKSRHLTGHAVDLAPWEGGVIHWDWPRFRKLAPAVNQAGVECGVKVEWGGNWTSFPDGPHWQLPWSIYP